MLRLSSDDPTFVFRLCFLVFVNWYINQNTSYPSELSQVAGPLISRRCVLSVVVASYVTPIVKTCRRLAALQIASYSCAGPLVIRSLRGAYGDPPKFLLGC